MAQFPSQKNTSSPIDVNLALGFWSAVFITIFNVVSTIMMIPSWFLNPITPWQGIEPYAVP